MLISNSTHREAVADLFLTALRLSDDHAPQTVSVTVRCCQSEGSAKRVPLDKSLRESMNDNHYTWRLGPVTFHVARGDIFDAPVESIVSSEQSDFILAYDGSSISSQSGTLWVSRFYKALFPWVVARPDTQAEPDLAVKSVACSKSGGRE